MIHLLALGRHAIEEILEASDRSLITLTIPETWAKRVITYLDLRPGFAVERLLDRVPVLQFPARSVDESADSVLHGGWVFSVGDLDVGCRVHCGLLREAWEERASGIEVGMAGGVDVDCHWPVM